MAGMCNSSALRRSAVAVATVLALVGCASSPAPEKVGEYAEDALVTARVKTALRNDPMLDATAINVETYDGVVQLSGFVGAPADRPRAAEVARGVSGVKAVGNALRLNGNRVN